LFRYPRPYVVPGAEDDHWERVAIGDAEPGDGQDAQIPEADLFQRGNQRLVRDLLASINEEREPVSSARDARNTLEMIQGIAAAHVTGGRITFPLRERANPLADFRNGESPNGATRGPADA
jgi:hypothetical protein